MVDEGLLARPIALVHPAELWDRLVRLVDEDEVVGEVVDQRVRWAALGAPVEDPRVVLDPGQNPSSFSISMSYSVRWRSRWASSSLPCPSNQAVRWFISLRISATPLDRLLLRDVVGRRTETWSISSSTSPVSGSKCWIDSISSPNSDTRYAVSAYAGKISSSSPLTRNFPA